MTTEQGKVQFIIEAIDNASSQLKSVQTAGLALSAAVTAIAGAFTVASKMSMDYGEKILSLSKITGETTETLSGLAFAAEQNETSIQAVTSGLGLLSKNMIGAQQGSVEMKNKFAEMGISIFDADGKMKSATTVMMEMADFMKTSGKSDTEKMAIAMLLLGRSGKELIPLMKEGSAGIKGMITEAAALGVVIDEATAKALDNMGDELSKIKTGVLGVAIILTKELTPYIMETTAAILNVIKTFNSWDAETRSVNIGMALFSVKLLALAAGVLLLIGYLPKIILLTKAFGAVLTAMPLVTAAVLIAGVTASIVEYMYQVEKAKNRNQALGQSHADILAALIKNNAEIKKQIRTHQVAGDEAKKLTEKYENQKTAIKKLTIEVENEKKKKKDLKDTNKELLLGMSRLEVAQEDGYNAYLKNEEAITAQEKATKDIVAVMGSYEVKIGDVHNGMVDLEETTVASGTTTTKMSQDSIAAWINMTKQILDSGVTIQNTFEVITNGVAQMVGSTNPVLGAVIQLGGSLIEKLFWGKKAAKPKEMIDENMKIINDFLESSRLKWANVVIDFSQMLADALQMPDITAGWSNLLSKMKSMFQAQLANQLSLAVLNSPIVQGLLGNITGDISYIGKLAGYKAEGKDIGNAMEHAQIWLSSNISDLMKVVRPMFDILGGVFQNVDFGLDSPAPEPAPEPVLTYEEQFIKKVKSESVYGNWVSSIKSLQESIVNSPAGGVLQDTIDQLYSQIEGLKNYLAQTWGSSLDFIGGLNQFIPAMASGGIVSPQPGGTLIRVAEAGQAEAIVPLNKMGGVTVNINNGMFLGTRAEMDSVFRKYLLPAMENYLGKTGGAF